MPVEKEYVLQTADGTRTLAELFDGASVSDQVRVPGSGAAAFGSFTAEVPAPLAIGTVTLEDGEAVKGFVAEPRAIAGALEITHLGGWRAFVAAR